MPSIEHQTVSFERFEAPLKYGDVSVRLKIVRFLDSALLKTHQRPHTKSLPFKLDIFLSKRFMPLRELIHTGKHSIHH